MMWGTADTEATDLVVFPNDDDFEDCVRPGAPPLTTTIFWGDDVETGRLNMMLLLFARVVLLLLWWWYPVLERRAHTKERFGGLLREISFFRYLILFFVTCSDTLNKLSKN